MCLFGSVTGVLSTETSLIAFSNHGTSHYYRQERGSQETFGRPPSSDVPSLKWQVIFTFNKGHLENLQKLDSGGRTEILDGKRKNTQEGLCSNGSAKESLK